MAHIGQAYKVIHRRDLNQNLATYRFGYPNQYAMADQRFDPRLSTFAGAPTPWYSNPPTYGSMPMAKYVWPPWNNGVHTLTFTFTLIKPRTPTFDLYAQLEGFVDGTSQVLTQERYPNPDYYAVWPLLGNAAFVYDRLQAFGYVSAGGLQLVARYWYLP